MKLEAAKRDLRRQVGARRRALSASSLDSVAERVCEHLFAERAFTGARRVAIYAALPDEVPTRPLFETLTRAGTTCLFPRVAPAGRLCFSRVERWDDLHPRGDYGILEPSEAAPVVEPGDGDVVVVPGVAFDRTGRRLGRGKGMYDRSFPASDGPQPLLFGVACEAQIVESVPADSHDRSMDAIVTERGFQWTKGGH
jgi:5-formyltetrahydrofolate cyclo-ligase